MSHGIERAKQRLRLPSHTPAHEVASLLHTLLERGKRLTPREVALRGVKIRPDANYYLVRYGGRQFLIVMHKPTRYFMTILHWR